MEAVVYAMNFGTNLDKAKLNLNNYSFEIGKVEYEKFAWENGIINMLQFYLQYLSKSSEDLLQYCTEHKHCSKASRKMYDFNQICYIPDLLIKDCSAIAEMPPTYLLLKNQLSNKSFDFEREKDELQIYVDPDLVAPNPTNNLHNLQKGLFHTIKIVPQQVILLSRGNRPCNSERNYSDVQCRFTCIQEEWYLKFLNCININYFGFEGSHDNNVTCVDSYILQFISEHYKDYRKIIRKCSQACIRSCSKVSYGIAITHRKKTLDPPPFFETSVDDILLEIVYDVCNTGIIIFEEYVRYSTESLIANIGGILGLWIGASTVTIVQLVIFSFDNIYNFVNRKRNIT